MKKIVLAALCLISSVLTFAGNGTKENPYSCAEAIELQQKAGYNEALVWVKGFIVGVPYQGNKGVIDYRDEATPDQKKQFALADDIYGTNWMPVRLNDDERLEIYNLSVYLHPEVIGQKVLIRTVPQPFYGLPGAKNSLEYELLTPIAVESVSLDKTEATLLVNQTLALNATISPADADNKRLTWSSSNASVASVDADGVVSALMNGEATITVKSVDGNKTATCKITVTTTSGEVLMGDVITADTTGITTNSLKENQPNRWSGKRCASGTIYAGKSAVSDGNISLKGGNGTDQAGIINTTSVGYLRQIVIEWASNAGNRKINVYGTNEAWTSVDNLFTGTGKTVTESDIIGTLDYSSGVQFDTIDVTSNFQYVGLWATSSNAHYFKKISFTWAINKTAEDVDLQSLALSETLLELEAEQTAKLSVTYNPTNATYKAVDWKSSNTSVATVTGGVVTAVAAGEANIIVSSRENPAISATCRVVVRKKDVFAGRDIYYKVNTTAELHTHDSIVLVNEALARVSADFETYETKEKDEEGILQTITLGRIRASETELVREADSIGSWGAEELHLVAIEGGKWKILAGIWEESELTHELERQEVELRATEKNKLQVKGEGTKTWTIDIVDGDAKIVSTDSKVGSLQFNSSNKTFTTYKTAQAAVQIYRKKMQTISTDDPEPDPDPDSALESLAMSNLIFVDGIIYNDNNLDLRVYNVAGQLITSGNGDLDLRNCQRGVYIVCSRYAMLKIVR